MNLVRRCYSSGPVKVPVKLISEIRTKRPGTPLNLAREALVSSGNDVTRALEYISEKTLETGAAKAEKLASRAVGEGLVGLNIAHNGFSNAMLRAGLVELRCETDFVARTAEFSELLNSISTSVSFFAEEGARGLVTPRDIESEVKQMPLIGGTGTIGDQLASAIARLGENITIKRASSVYHAPTLPNTPSFFLSSFVHGAPKSAAASTFQAGTLAGLVIGQVPSRTALDREQLVSLLRALARQTVALPTTRISAAGAETLASGELSTTLYDQPLITLPSTNEHLPFPENATVKDVIDLWSAKNNLQLDVVALQRWALGEE